MAKTAHCFPSRCVKCRPLGKNNRAGTLEVEAGGSVSSRSARAAQLDPYSKQTTTTKLS